MASDSIFDSSRRRPLVPIPVAIASRERRSTSDRRVIHQVWMTARLDHQGHLLEVRQDKITDALFHRGRVTLSGDVQVPVKGLPTDACQPGDFSDRQLALVVSVLCSPYGGMAELPFTASFPTPGPAGGQSRVGSLDEQLTLHLSHRCDDRIHQSLSTSGRGAPEQSPLGQGRAQLLTNDCLPPRVCGAWWTTRGRRTAIRR